MWSIQQEKTPQQIKNIPNPKKAQQKNPNQLNLVHDQKKNAWI